MFVLLKHVLQSFAGLKILGAFAFVHRTYEVQFASLAKAYCMHGKRQGAPLSLILKFHRLE